MSDQKIIGNLLIFSRVCLFSVLSYLVFRISEPPSYHIMLSSIFVNVTIQHFKLEAKIYD